MVSSPKAPGEGPVRPVQNPAVRDFTGYGRHVPHADWPGQARIAVQFVLNYEEGAERCILNGDATSEAFLSDIVNADPWPGQRHMNMESLYEYGSRAGFWRLWRLFTERDCPVSVNAVAAALPTAKEQIAAMKEAGWDLASHGLRWIDYRDFSKDDERAHIREAIALHRQYTGEAPLGWYTGRNSLNTLDLILEEGQFLYSSDSYADDLPYWVHGASGAPHLIIPYALDTNDMRFVQAQGFQTSDAFFAYLRDAFDTLYEEGAESPKLMSVGLHCRIIGRPGRTAALRKFVDYVQGKSDVWIARRIDVARHWHTRHPATE
jgi:putative urate catabolism protein